MRGALDRQDFGQGRAAELQQPPDPPATTGTGVISKGHPAPQPGPCSAWRPRSRGSPSPAESSPDTAESKGRACLLPAWPACKAPTTSQLTGRFHCFKKRHLGKISNTGEDQNKSWSCCPSAADQHRPATAAALAGGEILHPPAQTPPPDLRLPLPSSLLVPGTCWWSPRRSVTPSLPCSSLLSVPWRCLLNLGRGTLGFPSGLNMLAGASTMKAFVTGPGMGREEGTGQTPPRRQVRLLPGASGSPENRGCNPRRRQLPGLLPSSPAPGERQSPSPRPSQRGCGSAPRARQAAQGGAGRPGHPPQSRPAISSCRSRSCLLQ